MSEEFTFEQLYHFNWNDSVCLKSHKNLNFTMSDVSKNDIAQKLFSQEPEDNWNAEEFNKKAQKKLKNKLNVKNFRQRKKTQQDKLQKRMRHLEAENKMLKMDKFCRNCKKPYDGFIQMSELQKVDKKEENDQDQFQKYPHEGKQCFEFQKPRLYTNNKKQTNCRSGKIWVALGILMIVIGVHLYGLKGKQGYQDISISRIQSKKWIQIYQNKANGLDDYFNVKINVKQKSNPKSVQKQKEIFKQIRVFHQGQTEQKEKENQKTARSTFEKLQMVEQRNQKPIDQMDLQPNKQDEVRFHKELLYAIQAQIDDLGHYL